METEIKEALIRLMAAIKQADGTTVAAETARLDDLMARGRLTLPPQLVHFLEGRSYVKALAFLGVDPRDKSSSSGPKGK